jgi:rhodanese-related sulfurtransferase
VKSAINTLIISLLAMLCVCGVALPSRASSWSTLSPHQAHTMVKEGSGLWLVDVRNPATFEQGHIEGAVNIPHEQLRVKNLPKGKTIVLVDDSLGLRHAGDAAELLLKKGHEKVFVLEGGIPAWEAEKLPLTATRGDMLRPVKWDELAWARSASVTFKLYDLRDVVERTKGPVDGAVQPKGKNPGERIAAVIAELTPKEMKKGKPGKLQKPVPVVLILPNSGNSVDSARTAFKGVNADIRYLEGAYPLWVAREKEKPLPEPNVCPTCPAGREK